MKYSFTINHPNKAAEKRDSDDRNHTEALATAAMFQSCFPGAKIVINHPEKRVPIRTIKTDAGEVTLEHRGGHWRVPNSNVHFERHGQGQKRNWSVFVGGKQAPAIRRFTLVEAVWLWLRGYADDVTEFAVGDIIETTTRTNRGDELRTGIVTTTTHLPGQVNYIGHTVDHRLATGSGAFCPAKLGSKPFGVVAVRVIGKGPNPNRRPWQPKPGDSGYDSMH